MVTSERKAGRKVKVTKIFAGWNCHECGTLNHLSDISCRHCEALEDEDFRVFKVVKSDLSPAVVDELKYNAYWECHECGDTNPLKRKYKDNVCISCKSTLPKSDYKRIKRDVRNYMKVMRKPEGVVTEYDLFSDFSIQAALERFSRLFVLIALPLFLVFIMLIAERSIPSALPAIGKMSTELITSLADTSVDATGNSLWLFSSLLDDVAVNLRTYIDYAFHAGMKSIIALCGFIHEGLTILWRLLP